MNTTDTTETRTEKGASLARGPALILGTILLAAGLYFIYKQHTFPKLASFPNGNAPVQGKVFLGIFGANGWTGMLTAIAGGLLLFGAAQHLLAKAMSLIVGVALGAAAIIALTSGNVLGLAAANGWTELAWGAVAAILLLNAMIPRRRRTVTTGYSGYSGPATTADEPTRVRRDGAEAPTRQTEPVAARGTEPVAARRTEPVADRGTEPVAERGTEPMSTHHEEAIRRDEPVATRDEPVATREGTPTSRQ